MSYDYDPDEERDRDEARGLPWCCSQPMGWVVLVGPEGFWRCHDRPHHRQNDAGESVDEYGRPESDLWKVKMDNLYRRRP